MLTKVVNLRDDREVTYSLPPKEAVVVAHAQQDLRDFSTWEYWKYNDTLKIEEGDWFFYCGDWAARKEG